MQVKTNDGNYDVASKGLGNTALDLVSQVWLPVCWVAAHPCLTSVEATMAWQPIQVTRIHAS